MPSHEGLPAMQGCIPRVAVCVVQHHQVDRGGQRSGVLHDCTLLGSSQPVTIPSFTMMPYTLAHANTLLSMADSTRSTT